MAFYACERTAIFIDGPNLYGISKSLKLEIDFMELLRYIRARTILVRSSYYTTISDDAEQGSLRGMLDWLDYNGFQVVRRSRREIIDAQGRRRLRTSTSVAMSVDALHLSDKVDHVVLFAGDAELVDLVDALKIRGCRVSVAGSIKTEYPLISDEMRRAADHFIELDDMRAAIMRSRPTADDNAKGASADREVA